MHFSSLFALSTLVLAGISYATDKHLYVLQEHAGDDGLYHWRMLYGTKDPLKGTWHDVVWSDKCEIGMEHRSKEWRADKSKGVLGTFDLGHMKSQSGDKLMEVAKSTKTPQYAIEDLHKNCQTWVSDVVHKLVDQKELERNALTVLNTVPKKMPGSGSSSPKSQPGSPKASPPGSPKASRPSSPKASRPSSPKRRRSFHRARLARALTEAIKIAARDIELEEFAARMEVRNYWE